jgi:hypothetical protein
MVDWNWLLSYRPRQNRQKLWFLNLTFSDLKFFCVCCHKKTKIICISRFRKYSLKTIYSGTNFKSFLDFRLILSITAKSIFAVKPSVLSSLEMYFNGKFYKNKKQEKPQLFFYWVTENGITRKTHLEDKLK